LSDLNKTKKEIDVSKMSNEEKNRTIKTYRKKMEIAAKALDFIEAARIRDLIKQLKK
jgi:excinuclease UvrABC helicase subunit UvrB